MSSEETTDLASGEGSAERHDLGGVAQALAAEGFVEAPVLRLESILQAAAGAFDAFGGRSAAEWLLAASAGKGAPGRQVLRDAVPPVRRPAPVWGRFEPNALANAPLTKEEARSRGVKRFFSTSPCPSGHVGWRYARDGGCCECISPSHSEPGSDLHLKMLWNGARQRALQSGVPFELTVEDVRALYPADGKCPVLGVPFKRFLGKQGSAPDSATLDRIVPELGYVLGNVLVVCSRANRIHSDAGVEEIHMAAVFYRQFDRAEPVASREH